ncbi:DUF1799 domain-containing protein [Brucella tritici]|uniref:DUF1799 domain-containing protein n=1 Tax=Brucella tritici TaxID=94626 RepID=A0A6L3YUC8_9HYPH|nr:DUF1799 domain-containing protein [Brucella tritici]KAB2687520.1 DUF1799 domain-containing protein [Brucella tritici]
MGLSVQVEDIEQETVEIMPVNHDSFDAFLACQTQWRVAATMAGLFWQGLDYPAVRLVLDDIEAPRHVFADIRVMEAEALPILNERDD